MTTNRDPSFSIFEFKYWLSKQPEFKCMTKHSCNATKHLEELVGETVESRLGRNRLQHQIEKHNPDLSEEEVQRCTRTFKEVGGQVKKINDLNLIIELATTSFSLPKIYTKVSRMPVN